MRTDEKASCVPRLTAHSCGGEAWSKLGASKPNSCYDVQTVRWLLDA